MKNDLWAAPARTASKAEEPNADHVFSNFKRQTPSKGMSEAEARERVRRRGNDRMSGVVVETVRRRAPVRKNDEIEAVAPRF